MLIPLSAKGLAKDETMPVMTKPRGPLTLKARQFFSAIIPAGILFCGQTIDNSLSVRVREQKSVFSVHSGKAALLPKWQMPSFSGSTDNVSFFMFSICFLLIIIIRPFSANEKYKLRWQLTGGVCLKISELISLTGSAGRKGKDHTPLSARLALNRSGKDDFKFFFGGKFFLILKNQQLSLFLFI